MLTNHLLAGLILRHDRFPKVVLGQDIWMIFQDIWMIFQEFGQIMYMINSADAADWFC